MMTHDTDSLELQPLDQPVTEEMLAQWEAEIDAFFAETRSKLRALLDTPASEPPTGRRPADGAASASDGPHVPEADLGDEYLDRLQQVKRRLAARLEKSRAVEQAHGHVRETDSRPFPL